MVQQGEAVLVVDDEQTVVRVLQRFLEDTGYQVVAASSGEQALRKMNEQQIEVVLLDIGMPGISGMEVLQQISTKWPETCVIMVTGLDDANTAVKALKLGAYDYITKPFNRDDVMLAIRRGLEKRRLEFENENYRNNMMKTIAEQTEQLQKQFATLLDTLTREQQLIHKPDSEQSKEERELLSRLPPELQEPKTSVEEFRKALFRILGKPQS
jgi:DNA-binding NtrC family response regulator